MVIVHQCPACGQPVPVGRLRCQAVTCQLLSCELSHISCTCGGLGQCLKASGDQGGRRKPGLGRWVQPLRTGRSGEQAVLKLAPRSLDCVPSCESPGHKPHPRPPAECLFRSRSSASTRGTQCQCDSDPSEPLIRGMASGYGVHEFVPRLGWTPVPYQALLVPI